MPVPSGFVRTSRSPGARLRIGQDFFGRDDTGHGHAIDRLRVANGVPADDDTIGFLRFLDAAAQNLLHVFRETLSAGMPIRFNAVSGRPPIA